jgi:hypothetical protein
MELRHLRYFTVVKDLITRRLLRALFGTKVNKRNPMASHLARTQQMEVASLNIQYDIVGSPNETRSSGGGNSAA